MISLNEPFVTGEEILEIKKTIDKNEISNYGKIIEIFERRFSSYLKIKYSLALNSGTSALHLALKIIGVRKDDEIIVPTLTFIATVNSVLYNNAKPIFIDCDDDFNIDLLKAKQFILNETSFKKNNTYNKNTKKKIVALVIVNVWGNLVDLSSIKDLCKLRNIKIIEDATESLGAYFFKKRKRKYSRAQVDVSCYSFNGNKIITAGGGGMLVTNYKKYYQDAKYLSAQAKDDKMRFIHNNIGFNYGISSIQAAFGLAQFKKINFFLKKKNQIFLHYKNLFKYNKDIKLFEPNLVNKKSNYWMNVITFKKNINLKEIILFLKKNSIETRPIWFPNHLQKPFKKFQKYKITKVNRLIRNSLCIPSSVSLKKEDQLLIYNNIIKALKLYS
jgi:perosamine synthetase